jgi:hypothetical protein
MDCSLLEQICLPRGFKEDASQEDASQDDQPLLVLWSVYQRKGVNIVGSSLAQLPFVDSKQDVKLQSQWQLDD